MINLTDNRYNFMFKLIYGISANSSNDKKFYAAVNIAYTTFCRTIKFDNLKHLKDNEKKAIKTNLKTNVAEVIKQRFSVLKTYLQISQKEYDKWHCETCKNIIAIYLNNEYSIKLTHGQAQKWLNITLKHLYVMGLFDYQWIFSSNIKKYLHVAVDKIIVELANKKLQIKKPQKCWSSWDENTYQSYQEKLREKILEADETVIPFEWEFDSWDIPENND